MKNNQKKYTELKKNYSESEFAEGYYIPSKASKSAQKELSKEIWTIRKTLLHEMSPEDKIYAKLLGLKYRIKEYVENREYDLTQSVSKHLKEYMSIVSKKQKELSIDLDIHKTRLSRIINNRERMSLQLAYRLEIHSGSTIPAILWWKLVQKEVENEIKEDKKERKKERKKVKNIAIPNR